MKKYSIYFSYIIICIISIILITNTFVNDLYIIPTILFIIFIIVSLYKTLKNTKVLVNLFDKENLSNLIICSLATLITFSLSKYLGIPIILASSLIGFLGAIFLKRYENLIYCASFLAMTIPTLITVPVLLIASVFLTFIFINLDKIFLGYGGKLGMFAFVTSLIFVFLSNNIILIENTNVSFNNIYLILIISVLVSVITYVLNTKLKFNAVLASSSISLVFLTIFYFISKDLYLKYAALFFGATFVGMSFKKSLNIFLIIIAGFIFGYIFILNINSFYGIGGKLGAMAFMSTLVIDGVSLLYNLIEKGKYKIKKVN